MTKTLFVVGTLLAAAGFGSMPIRAQEVTKQDVEGLKNCKRLETTVACAGATKADGVTEIKKMGFASIINLREASEEGANVEAEEAAAKNVGIRYYHIPFNGSNPDPAVAEKFLNAITASGSDPAFIHCAGGNRAATMWLIKRPAGGHWGVDRATKETPPLRKNNEENKQISNVFSHSH